MTARDWKNFFTAEDFVVMRGREGAEYMLDFDTRIAIQRHANALLAEARIGEEMTALKPCPFCGGRGDCAYVDEGGSWLRYRFRYRCSQCGACGPWSNYQRCNDSDHSVSLKRQWNRRDGFELTEFLGMPVDTVRDAIAFAKMNGWEESTRPEGETSEEGKNE